MIRVRMNCENGFSGARRAGEPPHDSPFRPFQRRVSFRGLCARLHEKWRGSDLLHVTQGHFGYRMMPAVWSRLGERGLI